jgi:hypothetical protein
MRLTRPTSRIFMKALHHKLVRNLILAIGASIAFAPISNAEGVDPNCVRWFEGHRLKPGESGCELDCMVTMVGMSTFTCHSQCTALCKASLDCDNPPPGQCEFYDRCLEAKFDCGESGYPLAYGKKYCERFLNEKLFSDKGRRWRDETLLCLQRAIVPLRKDSQTTCEMLEKQAFESHPNCYAGVENSFCELPIDDWRLTWNVVDLRDELSPNGVRQALKLVFVSCREPLMRRLKELTLARLPPIRIPMLSAMLSAQAPRVETDGNAEIEQIKGKLQFLDHLEQMP